MQNKWDIIVVGGGPAGLFAAREAAEAGKSVLLLDRNQEIGLPVRCGEAIGKVDFAQYLPVEEQWISSEINTFILVLPNRKEIELQNDLYSGYIINRDLFEQDLAKKAEESGAIVKTCANVLDLILDDNKNMKGVICEENGELNKYYSNIVIAADGVESQIAIKKGIDSHLKTNEIVVCSQYYVSNANMKKNALYFYVGSCYAPGGYVWVFPKANNCANIGIGINGKLSSEIYIP